MPYFKFMLSGKGIDLPFDGVSVAGFYTTRLVRATDVAAAGHQAKKLVLSEWEPGGAYAVANRGSVPILTIEHVQPIGVFSGSFGQKASGYTFYRRED